VVAVAEGLEPGVVKRLYEAALLGLKRLDDAGVPPERFSPSADAYWETLKGSLDTQHRIDLLLRDASRILGPAFSPRLICRLPGLTDDDPFGPTWKLLPPQEAHDLWRAAQRADPLEPAKLVQQFAEVLSVSSPNGPNLKISAAEVLVAVGPQAAWRVWSSLAGKSELSWPRQVLVVADTPADRQFAGLLATLSDLETPAPTQLVDVDAAVAASPSHPFRTAHARLDRIVVESSSDEAVVELLRELYPSAEVAGC
jgi:hypothetical protein